MDESTEVFCVGCGLCKAYSKAKVSTNEKGFLYPVSGDEDWLTTICPIGNLPEEYYTVSKIWGRRKAIYYGWSNNRKLRDQASSGGVLSEIAIHLLNTKTVDGIIHVCANEVNQTENITTISYSAEEVRKKCGSRYSISHPLDILNDIDDTKSYALIGKPCDIVALRNYQSINPEHKKVIPILLSFFCMGLPSIQAQLKLLAELGSDPSICQSLTYRGNGWPGFATVINKDGSSKQIDYGSSWGRILGRDLMPACRFCLDGIGEAADISCGDAWYQNEDGNPDFSEHDGRNIVIARNLFGAEILNSMKARGVISLESVESPDSYLCAVQKSQLYRRASMKSRIAALRVMGKVYPKYSDEMLHMYSKDFPFKERARTFIGTCKRIIKGVI